MSEKDLRQRMSQRNPFSIPIGPTDKCLSSSKLVWFVKIDNESDSESKKHLDVCSECSERVKRFKAVS